MRTLKGLASAVVVLAVLAAAAAGCAGGTWDNACESCEREGLDEAGGSSLDEGVIGPPRALHWLRFGDTARLVFSRSEEDFGNDDERAVDHYVVCVPSVECIPTYTNYLDFDLGGRLRPQELSAVVWPVGRDGEYGLPSEESLYLEDLRLEVDGPEGSGAYWTAALGLSTPPSSVYSPVYGPIKIITCSNCSNKTDSPWGFWQHKTDYHKVNGGYMAADEVYAWDINLNVTGAGSNMDMNMDFLSVGYGTVVKWAGKSPSDSSLKPVLVDYGGWFAGYLHAGYVNCKTGDYASPWTILGRIGIGGATNHHLHFAVYEGKNAYDGLVSYDVSFKPNYVSIGFGSLSKVKVGTKVKLPALAYRTHATGVKASAVDLNSSAVYDNTWWTSSSKSVISVDGNGHVTAKAAGTATITVYYGGTKAGRTLTAYK